MSCCNGDHVWECTQCKDRQKASHYGFRFLVLGATFGVVTGAVGMCLLTALLEWAVS